MVRKINHSSAVLLLGLRTCLIRSFIPTSSPSSPSTFHLPSRSWTASHCYLAKYRLLHFSTLTFLRAAFQLQQGVTEAIIIAIYACFDLGITRGNCSWCTNLSVCLLQQAHVTQSRFCQSPGRLVLGAGQTLLISIPTLAGSQLVRNQTLKLRPKQILMLLSSLWRPFELVLYTQVCLLSLDKQLSGCRFTTCRLSNVHAKSTTQPEAISISAGYFWEPTMPARVDIGPRDC